MIQTPPFVPVLFGTGSSRALGKKAREMNITKMLVVCDQGIRRAGIVDLLLDSLSQEGISSVVFDKVVPDPPDTIINEAGNLAICHQVDGILGAGGGSSLDSAKAVNILVNNPGPISRWFGPCSPEGAPLPLILVPTTAGTGSECTSVSVVTDTADHLKKGIVSPRHTLARLAVVDPELYLGMPLTPTAYCAMDALTHAVDTLCRLDPQPFASIYAKEAIRLIAANLPRVMENGQDLEARSALAMAATLGGCAINGGGKTHLTHAIGHVLGSELHLPHGLACILCLPQLIRHYYAFWTPAQLYTVAECMGLSLPEFRSDSPENMDALGASVFQAVSALMKSANIPTFSQLGITREQLQQAVPLIPHDVTFRCAPHALTEEQLEALLFESL